MPTNEERREVARKLRHGVDGTEYMSDSAFLQWLYNSVGQSEDGHLLMRLADLIEPAKTGNSSLSGVCPKCGGITYVVCDDYDWWVITCDVCGAKHGFDPGNYIPYGEIENDWRKEDAD